MIQVLKMEPWICEWEFCIPKSKETIKKQNKTKHLITYKKGKVVFFFF